MSLRRVRQLILISGICENWGGLVEKIQGEPDEPLLKKKAKPTCLDKCAEWDFIKDVTSSRLPMFKNGNKVMLGKVTMNLQSTCAFDSIFQIVLNALVSNKTYRDLCTASSAEIISLAFSVLNQKKIQTEHYRERARILCSLDLFEDSETVYTRIIKRLVLECNICDLADYLFANEPSIKTKISCTCGFEAEHPSVIVSVNVNILLENGLHFMQKAIDTNKIKTRTCRACKNVKEDAIRMVPTF